MLFRRWFLYLLLSLASVMALRAATPEERAWNLAAESFALTAYEKAEREFGDFVQNFTNSAKIPEAVLLQAQARIARSNYAGALELLTARESQSGARADAYVFWSGEAAYGAGDYPKAITFYSRLAAEFPASTNRLEATVKHASALAHLGEWPKIIPLLESTNSFFYAVTRTNLAPEAVVRGSLLLAEAELRLSKPAEAEATLKPFAKLGLRPRNAWQWDYLMCQIQLAQTNREAALATSSNLIMMANNTEQPSLEAESYAFQAGLLEQLGRPDEAMLVYTNNLQGAVPSARQREALEKVTGLAIQQKRFRDGALLLERFAITSSNSPVADLGFLNAAELRLRHFAETNVATSALTSGTNLSETNSSLSSAQSALEMLALKYPQSPLLPKAALDLGWCHWYQNDFTNAAVSFQSAAEHLPHSVDAATARFKAADSLFARQEYRGAITNYDLLIAGYADLNEVKTNLFEAALYQIIRSAIAANDLSAATNALTRIEAWYPRSYRTKAAVLLNAQFAQSAGDALTARSLLADFIAKAGTNRDLTAEAELALAGTLEQQRDWARAVSLYDVWVAHFTNHAALPRAEYNRALAVWHATDETNALPYFTNFVAHFPSNSLTPLAARWVADYYFTHGAYTLAETEYQLLSRTWPGSEFAWQARLMAGRAAARRYSFKDAAAYFLELYTNAACPPALQFQALYELGDTYMSQESTNKLDDYKEAIGIFKRITQEYATNDLASLAYGEMASCYLQWAQTADQLTNAIAGFKEVLNAPAASPAAKEIARVGIGVVLERQAKDAPADQQKTLRAQALDQYLQAFQNGDNPDADADRFWTKKSGLEAIRLAMELQQWSVAEAVCERMMLLLPQLQPTLQEKIQKIRAQQSIARGAG